MGRKSKIATETARQKIAAAIGAKAEEIYFTGGGSEADNWAIRSVVEKMSKKGRHIISTAIEHHAVLHTLKALEKQGCEVTYLPVDSYGQISLDELKDAIRDDTILITIMMANNEIGTILPIAEVSKIAKERGILVHTDAVQAVGHIPVDVDELGVDIYWPLTGWRPKGHGRLRKKGPFLPAPYGRRTEKDRRRHRT